MKRVPHLYKVMLVAAVPLLMVIGQPNWWWYIIFVCYLYYLNYIANLFFKLFERDNAIARRVFGSSEAPMIAGFLMMGIWIVVRKTRPEINPDELYYCAFFGFFTTIVARLKAGRWQRR
jgi:hypothetical protein